MLRHWFDYLVKQSPIRHRHGARRRPRPALPLWPRPVVELLEDRTLLSTITVTNNQDSGAGSLRNAIAQSAAGDTINFDSSLQGATITLISGQLAFGHDLTIAGLGAAALAVSGDGLGRVFVIAAGANVAISGLTIDSGLTVGDGTADGSNEG